MHLHKICLYNILCNYFCFIPCLTFNKNLFLSLNAFSRHQHLRQTLPVGPHDAVEDVYLLMLLFTRYAFNNVDVYFYKRKLYRFIIEKLIMIFLQFLIVNSSNLHTFMKTGSRPGFCLKTSSFSLFLLAWVTIQLSSWLMLLSKVRTADWTDL